MRTEANVLEPRTVVPAPGGALATAQAQLFKIAGRLGVDPAMRDLLSLPKHTPKFEELE